MNQLSVLWCLSSKNPAKDRHCTPQTCIWFHCAATKAKSLCLLGQTWDLFTYRQQANRTLFRNSQRSDRDVFKPSADLPCFLTCSSSRSFMAASSAMSDGTSPSLFTAATLAPWLIRYLQERDPNNASDLVRRFGATYAVNHAAEQNVSLSHSSSVTKWVISYPISRLKKFIVKCKGPGQWLIVFVSL